MPFIASNGLTEAGTSKTIAAGGMSVHYHDLGEGEPVLFLHSYGPGTTAALPLHPDGPAEFFEDGPYRLPRGGARGPGPDRGRLAGRPRHPAGILGRQLARRAVGDGGGHRLMTKRKTATAG